MTSNSSPDLPICGCPHRIFSTAFHNTARGDGKSMKDRHNVQAPLILSTRRDTVQISIAIIILQPCVFLTTDPQGFEPSAQPRVVQNYLR